MKIRIRSLARLVLVAGLCLIVMMICDKISGCIERFMPDLADQPLRQARADQEKCWNVPSTHVYGMKVIRKEGIIPGRATAKCWRVAGRIYYRISGPDSRADDASGSNAKKFVFCEAVYEDDLTNKVEQFSHRGAAKLWRYGELAIARSMVSANRYRIERDGSYAILTFWTPENEPAKAMHFYYQKDGQEGHLSLYPHKWRIPQLEQEGSVR